MKSVEVPKKPQWCTLSANLKSLNMLGEFKFSIKWFDIKSCFSLLYEIFVLFYFLEGKMFNLNRIAAATIIASAAVSGAASAATITNGFTYSVADSCNAVGTHFHSATGGALGNPRGLAEVGNFECEGIRGLYEYDLSGHSTATSACVTFDVYQLEGLFPEFNDFYYDGPISLVSCLGDNLENLGGFQAPPMGSVGSFDTAGLGIGDVLGLDIPSLFNDAINSGDPSLGIRLAIAGAPNGGAIVFNNFRLATTDETTTTVPLPSGLPLPLPLLLWALGGLGFVLRRRRSAQSATSTSFAAPRLPVAETIRPLMIAVRRRQRKERLGVRSPSIVWDGPRRIRPTRSFCRT